MATVIDLTKTMKALFRGEATPEQQREASCLLILLKSIDQRNWEHAERFYIGLRGPGLITLEGRSDKETVET